MRPRHAVLLTRLDLCAFALPPRSRHHRECDENPGFPTSSKTRPYLPSANCDARNFFRIRFYLNCRVSPAFFSLFALFLQRAFDNPPAIKTMHTLSENSRVAWIFLTRFLKEELEVSFCFGTHLPLYTKACVILYFHVLTNCPFSISFILIFMHRMGDIGSGVVTPLLKKNFRLSADSPDIETFRRSHVQALVMPLTTVPKTFPFTLLRTLLHSPKTQLFSFQSIPHSLPKTPGGGVPPFAESPAPAEIPWRDLSYPYFLTSLLHYFQKRRRPSRSDGAAAKRACRLQERRPFDGKFNSRAAVAAPPSRR